MRAASRERRARVRSVRDQLPAAPPQRPNLGVPGSGAGSTPTGGDGCRSHRSIRRDVQQFLLQCWAKVAEIARFTATRKGRSLAEGKNLAESGQERRSSWRMLDVRTVDRKKRHFSFTSNLFTCIRRLTTAARLTSRERA